MVNFLCLNDKECLNVKKYILWENVTSINCYKYMCQFAYEINANETYNIKKNTGYMQ